VRWRVLGAGRLFQAPECDEAPTCMRCRGLARSSDAGWPIARLPGATSPTTATRYPPRVPVAQLSSRFRSFPRNRYPVPDTRPECRSPSSPAVSQFFPRLISVRIPARSAGCPILQPFPGVAPESGTRSDTRPKCRSPGPSAVLGVPRERYPSLAVNEFLQPQPGTAQGFSRGNFKILWPSTGHPGLSPAPSGISTELSTDSSTASGISAAQGPWPEDWLRADDGRAASRPRTGTPSRPRTDPKPTTDGPRADE
jgi:hypothetical protein